MDRKVDILNYKSGAIKRMGQYYLNKKHGQWVFFYESGVVCWIGNYIEGKEFGIWKEWYENGELKEECKYQNGEKVALNFWDENGHQILKDGTGYTIEKFGTNEGHVYKHHFKNGIFQKEEKVSSVTYGKFAPNYPTNE